MDDFVAGATDRLRAQGYRVTRARRQVIDVLATTNRALSPYGIVAAIGDQRTLPDLVTVYRVLELLSELGLVHRVHSLNGFVACTRLLGDGCHHPIICTNCGRIEEVRGEGLARLEKDLSAVGWEVSGHVLELTGLCPECLAARERD